MVVRYFSALLFIFFAFSVSAEESKRGLYWGEKPEPEQEQIEKKAKEEPVEENEISSYTKPSVPEVEEMMTWHPEQIRQLFTQVHEYHVMSPTLQTATDMQAIKAVMNKKARAAAAVEQLALRRVPQYSGVVENPVNPTARSLKRQDDTRKQEKRLVESRDNYALIMFTQKDCPACIFQKNVMRNFVDQYRWRIKEVDIDENILAKARFNISAVPTIILISKASQDDWIPVILGVDALSQVKLNIDQGISLLQEDIDPTQWLTAPSQRGSLYDPKSY